MGKEKESHSFLSFHPILIMFEELSDHFKIFSLARNNLSTIEFWISFRSCVLIHDIDGIPRSQQLSCNLQNKLKIYSYNKERKLCLIQQQNTVKIQHLGSKVNSPTNMSNKKKAGCLHNNEFIYFFHVSMSILDSTKMFFNFQKLGLKL